MVRSTNKSWTRILLTLTTDGFVKAGQFLEGDESAQEVALKAANAWKFKQTDQLPEHITLSLASVNGKAFVAYGVLKLRPRN